MTHRLDRIVRSLGDGDDPEASLDWVCRACATELGVNGATVTLIDADHDLGSIGASDERASAVVDLQFGLGEGPTIDAHRSGRPVLVPDLVSTSQWPAFASEAVAIGAAAVFALPLQIGAARFGALTCYRDRSGSFGDGPMADALMMADIASEIVLCLQADVPPGTLHHVVENLATQRAVVYQATGMVLVQLSVGPKEAAAALRARAFASGRTVRDVAADVVARVLRFEP